MIKFSQRTVKMKQQSALALTNLSVTVYRNTRRTRYVLGFLCKVIVISFTFGKWLLKKLYKFMCTRIGRILMIIMLCHLINYLALQLYVKYCHGDNSVYQLIVEFIYGKSYFNPVCKQLLFVVYMTNNKVFSYLTGTQLLEYWFSLI